MLRINNETNIAQFVSTKTPIDQKLVKLQFNFINDSEIHDDLHPCYDEKFNLFEESKMGPHHYYNNKYYYFLGELNSEVLHNLNKFNLNVDNKIIKESISSHIKNIKNEINLIRNKYDCRHYNTNTLSDVCIKCQKEVHEVMDKFGALWKWDNYLKYNNDDREWLTSDIDLFKEHKIISAETADILTTLAQKKRIIGVPQDYIKEGSYSHKMVYPIHYYLMDKVYHFKDTEVVIKNNDEYQKYLSDVEERKTMTNCILEIGEPQNDDDIMDLYKYKKKLSIPLITVKPKFCLKIKYKSIANENIIKL